MNAFDSVYAELQPRQVWRHFAALNEIPRATEHEAAALKYVRRIAEENGGETQQDARGNMVVRLKTNTNEQAPVVAIQAHLDMVCQKRPETQHDFLKDPIVPRRDGDWIFATGTTLGADNGMGAAMALATITSDIAHGPLELLFTVEEESGLFGAADLDPALLAAPFLINLDSEDPDEITVGCAGGAGIDMRLETAGGAQFERTTEIRVGGLAGGHSGMQIHEPLANANKILVEILRELARSIPVSLVSIEGGNAHNAIPRDARAIFGTRDTQIVQPHFRAATLPILERWKEAEPRLQIEMRSFEAARAALDETATEHLLQLLHDLPHGVLQMSKVFEGKVETSANLAMISAEKHTIKIHVSVRSFREAEKERVLREIGERAQRAQAVTGIREGYPGWEPEADSLLLERTREAFTRTQGREPVVQVVHAGLECGLLVAKKPDLEAISFGPHIRGAHTPEECVEISSVAASWKLLCALLEDLSNQRPS